MCSRLFSIGGSQLFLSNQLEWMEQCLLPKDMSVSSLLEPVNVTLAGKGVSADVINLNIAR